jgi:hypothetical protein
MSLDNFATWLDATPLSTSLKTNFWVVPTLQSIHILSVCLVLSTAVIVSLRAWNLMGVDWTPQTWARRLYPPQWWALLGLLVTGIFQVLAEPTRELPNQYFQFKMLGVLITVPIVLWMTRRFYAEGAEARVPGLVRLASIVVVALWGAIIFAGRWIAYA